MLLANILTVYTNTNKIYIVPGIFKRSKTTTNETYLSVGVHTFTLTALTHRSKTNVERKS